MARDAIAEQRGQTFGVVPRIAKQLGVGAESLRGWLKQAEIEAGHRPWFGTRAAASSGWTADDHGGVETTVVRTDWSAPHHAVSV